MSRLLRSIVLVLSGAHVIAATIPCAPAVVAAPPQAHEAAEPMSHSGPAHHASRSGHDQSAAHAATSQAHVATSAWKAPCPCGCDRAPGKDLPGHKLDPGLPLARTVAPAALEAVCPTPAAPRAPTVFPDGPNRIPIFA